MHPVKIGSYVFLKNLGFLIQLNTKTEVEIAQFQYNEGILRLATSQEIEEYNNSND